MAILRSHHIAMKTGKFAEMKKFYTETLGFPIAGQIPGREVCFIDIGGTTIELIPADTDPGASVPACGLVHLAFEVDDVESTYRELVAKGVPFHIEPRGMGDIHMAFFKDPDGNPLELFQSPTLTWAGDL